MDHHATAAVAHLPTLLTIAEAARALRVSSGTVRRLIRAGRLRATKTSPVQQSRVLVTRASLAALLELSDLSQPRDYAISTPPRH